MLKSLSQRPTCRSRCVAASSTRSTIVVCCNNRRLFPLAFSLGIARAKLSTGSSARGFQSAMLFAEFQPCFAILQFLAQSVSASNPAGADPSRRSTVLCCAAPKRRRKRCSTFAGIESFNSAPSVLIAKSSRLAWEFPCGPRRARAAEPFTVDAMLALLYRSDRFPLRACHAPPGHVAAARPDPRATNADWQNAPRTVCKRRCVFHDHDLVFTRSWSRTEMASSDSATRCRRSAMSRSSLALSASELVLRRTPVRARRCAAARLFN